MEIEARNDEYFLTSFARSIGSTVENGRVDIPAKYGKGYVFGYLWDQHIRLIIRKYKLKDDILIKRGESGATVNMIQIVLHNILKEDENDSAGNEERWQLPSVIVTTQGLDPEIYIPGNTSFNTIKLAVEASYIKQLIGPDVSNALLRNIIENSQPLIFEQFVSLKLEQIANEMIGTNVENLLHDFFYKVKSEEIIYYLLMELTQRQNSRVQALNIDDVRRIYAAREKLLEDLANPPTLDALAAHANMSLSKLKRLFKQVYGKNVYQYYQDIRMKEAAYLLKHKGLSVSEVGYNLGFSNLSHFARVFEEHVGVKPKKYSML